MTDSLPHPLLSALLNQAGRRAPGAAQLQAWHAYARFLLAARRRVLESPPCPTPVVRRVHGLFRERKEGPVASILRLVFDSWVDAAPAVRGRGHARSLRYEGESGAVDLLVEKDDSGHLTMQVAAEPIRPGLVVSLEGRDETRRADLDDTGFAELRVSTPLAGTVVVVREGEQEVLRTPPLPGAG